MKFIDKIKNYFYDDEDEEASKKKAVSVSEQPTTKQKTVTKDEGKAPIKDTTSDVVSERELFRSESSFNFPIIFDDEDFKDDKRKDTGINVLKKEQTKAVEFNEKRVFKPSPNISPVYGIIDTASKTETKNDSDNLFNLYETNKKVDIDDVLGRVYSAKRVEMKRDNYTETKSDNKDDLTIDLFNSVEPQPKEEILKVEHINEQVESTDEKLKTIDELLANTDEEDFYSLVDSMYKEDKEGDN
ncbi:MAG: hypothetical protein WC343_04770 [Bacilli bacterium]|jgi:hypothetical protein